VTAAAALPVFGDRVADAVAGRRSQLVLGLDPDPARLWPGVSDISHIDPARMPGPTYKAAQAVERHCVAVIDAVAEECVAVKLQVACFERLGAPGWAAMVRTGRAARERGLLVIADGKRGDIDVSAAAYGQAFFGAWTTPFGEVTDVEADALTVNPLLGMDALTPLVERARMFGGGLFVLVRTSNPGASDVQDLELSAGGTVSDRLAAMVAELGAGGVGHCGLSDIGAVVGATVPERIAAMRARMPEAILLLPGVGAQGGSVERLGPAFAPGPAGGLVTASRAIVDAHRDAGGDPAGAARAQAARLREAIWELANCGESGGIIGRL
jgi:orotidine-5'-phosphate decarboxylase